MHISCFPHWILPTLFNIYSYTPSKPYCQMMSTKAFMAHCFKMCSFLYHILLYHDIYTKLKKSDFFLLGFMLLISIVSMNLKRKRKWNLVCVCMCVLSMSFIWSIFFKVRGSPSEEKSWWRRSWFIQKMPIPLVNGESTLCLAECFSIHWGVYT